MNIEIPSDKIADIFSASILQAMSEGQKENLIQGAITHLISKPPSVGYGGVTQTPLEKAFKLAVEQCAREYAQDVLSKDPSMQQIFSELTEKIRNADYDTKMTIQRALSAALVDALVNCDTSS